MYSSVRIKLIWGHFKNEQARSYFLFYIYAGTKINDVLRLLKTLLV